MVEFRCTCGFNGEVEDELAGNRVKCPRCGTVVARPRAETQGIKAAGESVHVPLREAVPLRKMKILKKSLGITFLAVFMCFMFSVAFGADDHSTRMTFIRALEWGGWLLIAAMIIGGFPVYQYFYFKRYFYDIEGDNLIIRKGVIAYREVTLPFSKITDIYVDRDIMDAISGYPTSTFRPRPISPASLPT